MANQEQLDRLLKQDVYTWNHWRSEHLEIHLDLRDADLTRANLDTALQLHFQSEQE